MYYPELVEHLRAYGKGAISKPGLTLCQGCKVFKAGKEQDPLWVFRAIIMLAEGHTTRKGLLFFSQDQSGNSFGRLGNRVGFLEDMAQVLE